MEQKLSIIMEQVIRLLQMVGIPVGGALVLIGLLVILTSGKNPRRKRFGYIITIGFMFVLLLIAYLPLIAYNIVGNSPKEASGLETLQSMVNASTGLGEYFFRGIQYASIPLVVSMFYIGVLLFLLAAKSPQRKRLGIGIMILSPIVLGFVFTLPFILGKL